MYTIKEAYNNEWTATVATATELHQAYYIMKSINLEQWHEDGCHTYRHVPGYEAWIEDDTGEVVSEDQIVEAIEHRDHELELYEYILDELPSAICPALRRRKA